MKINLLKTMRPTQCLVGALVFLFPFLALVTLFGVGLSSFMILIASLCCAQRGIAALRLHWHDIRWVVLAFLFNVVFALLCLALRAGEHVSVLEKPARMLLSVSALMLVLVFKPERRYLWWGVIGGALAASLLIGHQRLVLGMVRPGGLINAITFGDLALLLALLALAAGADWRTRSRAPWPQVGAYAGALAGVAGSVMTGSRGAWLALALAACVFVRYSVQRSKKRLLALVLLACVVLAGLYLVRATGVALRIDEGVHDVSSYFSGGSVFSNLGIRLELWKGALLMIAEHPLAGQSVGHYQAAIDRYVADGRLDPAVLSMPHLHNDALQALVTGGITGFGLWLATLAAPLVFFARALAAGVAAGQRRASALAGMLVVVSYFSFGLTEVIFWSMKSSLFYALMVFLLMGFCLNEKDDDERQVR